MSVTMRPSDARGHANHGWLDTFHTFSFAHYYDAAHMGFRDLRVINEDVVKPGTGFGTHGHRDMEIVTYVIEGALAHRDSTGGEGVLRRGDVQYMSAGNGVRHSEFNASDSEDVHLLQIWVLPPAAGLPTTYDQKHFADAEKRNRLKLLVSPDGEDEALIIHQDVRIYASILDEGISVRHALGEGRGAWVQVVDGSLEVNGSLLQKGDGLAIEEVAELAMTAKRPSEFLLFDLA